jgi:hypothetical protein
MKRLTAEIRVQVAVEVTKIGWGDLSLDAWETHGGADIGKLTYAMRSGNTDGVAESVKRLGEIPIGAFSTSYCLYLATRRLDEIERLLGLPACRRTAGLPQDYYARDNELLLRAEAEFRSRDGVMTATE